MKRRRICAVIPAAGRGTRSGLGLPKILAPLAPDVTVWSLLRERLLPHVERIVVVLSPDGAELFARSHLPSEEPGRVLICVQREPLGMADAVLSAASEWAGFDEVVVVWGDQVGVSAETIERTAREQRRLAKKAITLPLVATDAPYVQYDFDAEQRLVGVRQSREGDVCDAHGLSDVGCFALSADGLAEALGAYVANPGRGLGKNTGEINFLPFLVYLSEIEGWSVHTFAVRDSDERFGINTAEELAFFRQLIRRQRDA